MPLLALGGGYIIVPCVSVGENEAGRGDSIVLPVPQYTAVLALA